MKVTFFTVGNSLYDNAGNFTAVYREAIARGTRYPLLRSRKMLLMEIDSATFDNAS
jgi:hypothetical protein